MLFLRKARYFRGRGHEVFFASAGGPLERELEEAGIPHLTLPSVAQFRPGVPYDEALGDARRLARHLARNRIEIVDALPVRPFLMAHHIAGAFGIPVFLECLSPTHAVPVRHAALARAAANSGRMIAMDPDDAAGSCPRLGVSPEKVRILPNPIDTGRFKPGPPDLRLEVGVAPAEFLVLSASRLDPDKAGYVRMLIDDFAGLAAADPGAWLVIAGDGSQRATLEAAVADRGIPRVRFIGMRSDLERVYPGADAFVGMGTTVLEAAACGVPVVVANALSLRQGAVSPDEAAMCYFGHLGATTVGYRYPLAEPGTFRSYLERLRRNPELRSAVAQEGLATVRAVFSQEQVLGEWERTFQAAIALERERKTGPFEPPDIPSSGKILFVTRPDALTNPGGDTIQMLRTREELERLGIGVDISFSAAPDPRGYDLVHLFNLQLAGLSRTQLRAVRSAGVPAVVSPIFWDHAELDHFSPRLRRAFAAAPEARPRLLALLEADTREGAQGAEGYPVGPRLLAQREIQRQVAAEADLLLPNSRAEASILAESLGSGIAPCHIVPNGIDPVLFTSASPDAFEARFGRRDFVLSAARWDDRKNLLMLCEALRGTGLPLVLVGGRPNDEYEQLVRSALPPDTLVIDPLGQDELASAYAAARVHALPSWFETPGLSSMEAAIAGCAVVVGNRGAEREYFGSGAYYCDPASVGDIRRAIVLAWESFEADRPRRAELRERLMRRYTWGEAARRTVEAYERVLGCPVARHTRPPGPASPAEKVAPLEFEMIRVADGPAYGKEVAEAIAGGSAEVAIVLAPDVSLPGGAVELLVAALAADAGIGASGPVSNRGAPLQLLDLYLPPEAITGRSDAEIAHALGRSGRAPVQADLLDRFCLAIRRSALARAGGWDPTLAPAHAELDLAWRLRQAGLKLAVATGAFVRSPGRAGGGADPDLLAESADRLAAKLEAHHGRGRVPRAEALWGVTTFEPRLDLWGPRPTRFRMSLESGALPYRERVEAAFTLAFGPDDPVALDLVPAVEAEAAAPCEPPDPAGGAPDQAGDTHIPPGAARPVRDAPAILAAEAIAGYRQDRAEAIVELTVGAPVPGHDPSRITSASLRQVAGYRPQPLGIGLTSIIVVAVDQPDYTKLCLETLFERTREPFEAIVVDGGVGDRTRAVIARLASRHPGLLLLRTESREPAAGLMNLGLAAARGEFAVVLRGDVVVSEGWLTYCLAHLAGNPGAGAVGPRSNGGPGDQPILEMPYDDLPGMHGFARDLARDRAGLARPVSLVGAFAFVTRREVFETAGGFDPTFPTGTFEAPDYCLRTLLAGREVLLAQDAYVHHFGLHPPGPEALGDAVEGGLAQFREKWGPLPEARDIDAVEFLRSVWADRPDRPAVIPLPGRRGLPLVVNPACVEGARDRNLLLLPDWAGDPHPWENTIRKYAEAFSNDSAVALFLPAAPGPVLQRISALLEEVRPDGDTPDVLILQSEENLAGIVAASQGVIRIGSSSDDVVCRIAEILGKPVLSNPRLQDLEAWESAYSAISTASSHKHSC